MPRYTTEFTLTHLSRLTADLSYELIVSYFQLLSVLGKIVTDSRSYVLLEIASERL